MNFYYGRLDDTEKTWGFVEETDNKAWEDEDHTQLKATMIFITQDELQKILAELSPNKEVVGYGGECFCAEKGKYYLDENGDWVEKSDIDFNIEKANQKAKELINTLYEIKAAKAYGGIIINEMLTFETNMTAITNTVASLALMKDTDTASWKFYTLDGVPYVQAVTKLQLAGIAQFAQAMINQCFEIEGVYNLQLQAASIDNLLNDEWVAQFLSEANASMEEVNNKINVQFS